MKFIEIIQPLVLLLNIACITPLLADSTAESSPLKDEYDLTRVIDTVMVKSLQIISASEESNAAKANIKEAQSAYYPQFGVTAEYQHFTFVPVITLGNLSMPFGTANAFDGHANLQLKIYDLVYKKLLPTKA